MILNLSTKIYSEDKVVFFPEPSMGLGSKIFVYRANPITVIDGKNSNIYRTWTTTVEDFLVENKIELGEKDEITPKLDGQLLKNQKIKILRVAETTVSETEEIDFEIVEKEDPELLRGKTKISQEGIKGVREKKYLVRREDGEEVSRTLVSNEITKKPQNKIVLYGTKVNFIAKGKASHVGKTYSAGLAAYRGLRGKRVLVRNFANGKEVEVTITDYGPDPKIHPDRIIDLSGADFNKISGGVSGVLSNVGVALIE